MAMLFFMFEAHGPQGITRRVAIRSPPYKEAGSGDKGHVAHRSPSSGSRATVHVAASEPFLSGRRDPEPSQRVWSHSTCDSARAILIREVGSRAAGHVAASEPTFLWEVESSTAGHVAAHGCMARSLS
jgi:hypothetical protein